MRRRALPFLVAVALLVGGPSMGAAAEASGGIAGRITGAGAPLGDICVDALGGLGGGTVASTETGADGRYQLTGLLPGSYLVAFRDCDPVPSYVDRLEDDIAVVSGAASSLDVVLDVGGFVAGHVTDGAGAPVGGICAHAVSRDDGELAVVGSTTSARDGSYRLGPLAAGDTLLAFVDCRPAPSLVGQFLGGGFDVTRARPTAIRSGTTATADVALAPGATITGRVDDGTGTPHRGACLSAEPGGGPALAITAEATSGNDGSFVLGGLPPGTYHVGAGRCPDTGRTGADVTVTAGQHLAGLALTLPASRVARLAGTDRVASAVAVAEDQPSTSIVLAGDASPADALAAAPLAVSLDAPLLLTRRDALAPAVLAYVRAHHVSDAVVLGGTGAVSAAVEGALQAAGVDTSRIAGADRFATAAAVAAQLDADSAYVVAEDDWPDAVAISTLAALEGRPILLTGRHELPDATAEVVGGMATVDVVGGPAAIGDEVVAALAATVPHVGRVGGADRFDTSARVARIGADAGLPYDSVWVTSGRSWSDGLVAGVAAARGGGPLLLLGDGTGRLLRDHADELGSLVVVGGTAQLSPATFASLAALPASGCARTDRC